MMHEYRLSANAAKPHQHGYTVCYSLIGDLEGANAVVMATSPSDLVALKLAHGKRVLAHNSHHIQSPAVTSPPTPLTAVAVSHRPVKRHGPGFKALPFQLMVTRED